MPSIRELQRRQKAIRYRLDIGQGGPLKAHDIRHLVTCEGCIQLADDRNAIATNKPSKYADRYAHWHPACFYEKRGAKAVLALPAEERSKFRMCDIPVPLMRRLVDRE